MVIGGGPGGLHAAMVAAQRGHQVTLCEKQDRLGGQFNLAVIPPGKQELTKATQFLARQVDKAGVKVQLNTEVTAGDGGARRSPTWPSWPPAARR